MKDVKNEKNEFTKQISFKNSKNSLLSEVAESNNKELIDLKVPKNDTSILEEYSSSMYQNFKTYIVSKVDEEKTKVKSNIDVIKKTSSWNQERTKLFLNYLDETINAGNHILSEE
jgi:hypothetical protein